MTMISFAAKHLARARKKRFDRWYSQSVQLQEALFQSLIQRGRRTAFGREHNFDQIKTHEQFVENVPIRDYEGIKPYIDRIIEGERNVLWPGRPMYLTKTSGTTSGAKYIPISRESMPYQVDGARNALLMYLFQTGDLSFVSGRMMFISGSPAMDTKAGIPTGRLSGISHRHVPFYLRWHRLPSYKVNTIELWEEKVDAIVQETLKKNISLVSGIPPWVEMYFERLLEKTGKETVGQVFPNMSLFVHGGVSFQPYEQKFHELMGKEIPTLETFPASEGFLGFQDRWPSQGMVIIPDGGIFYEFIPAHRFYEDNPPRYTLGQVETGTNYVVILNTNAGLWGYNIGDTIRFESINPFRFASTGRLSHYTSAFGEHVIVQEAEDALAAAAEKTNATISEFTLAPLVNNPDGLPRHQWFVEYRSQPRSLDEFASVLDQTLQEKNPYYKDLVAGKILQKAQVISVPEDTFHKYMKAIGKLGGQNKVPHLSDNRKIADWIMENMETENKSP